MTEPKKQLPAVVSYTDEILKAGSPGRLAGSFESIFKKTYPSAPITILDYHSTPENYKDEIRKAEVLVTSPALLPSLMPYSANVKWVQFTFAGYDPFTKYLQQTQNLPNFKVTRMAETFGTAMSEYVIAEIVAHERRFQEIGRDQKLKRWRFGEFKNYRVLSELTIGIVGAGDIGCEVAKYCKSFGMRTIGLVSRERTKEERSKFIDEYRLSTDLPYLLSESDVICNLLPSNPCTQEFFKDDTFHHCTKKPLFINIGRGDAVKSSTIVSALRDGCLSGAVLDVVDPEPLSKDSELWDVPEVIITPHMSGCVGETFLAKLFLQNYDKFVKGEQMDHEVDLAKLTG